jgi:REP element-mobilizing transposase RayT
VLKLFDIGDGRYEFWSRTNMPKAIGNEDSLIQKINYIHENPVRRQYVKNPEDWMWSSANPNNDIVIEPMVL